MLSEPELLTAFNERSPESIGVIQYIPMRTIIRLVDRFPDELLDGKLFKSQYNLLPNIGNSEANDRLKIEAKERVISLLKDALMVQNEQSARLSKNEMTKCAWSIAILQGELVR